MYYDIIIIGSGISGLYAAYNIQKMSPSTSFIILEKYKKNWIGGRTSNDMFYGTQIVTGAGIGRKNKDKLLIQLLNEMDLSYEEFPFTPYYSTQIDKIVDIKKVIQHLKNEYNKHKNQTRITFKEFAKPILGDTLYNDFLVSAGYTDYENEDAFDVIQNYGMDDNACCWKGLYINWKQLVTTLHKKIGIDKIKTSMNVVSIKKTGDTPCLFSVETDNGIVFESNKVIVATTIDSIKQIIPGASNKNSIYNEIKGQTFLRLYGKFSKKSSEIMKQYIKGYTIVPGPLQKIIPMDASKGVYMIAYSDNANATFLKKYLENTSENRDVICHLIEKALGLPDKHSPSTMLHMSTARSKSLELIAIKDYYWPIGTHYYTPLTNKYENREEFIHTAQHPENGILVVGEVVSDNQGWTNGALSSVKAVLNKKWIKTLC
jgi:hypothetical protein